jgi:hypothetical protein
MRPFKFPAKSNQKKHGRQQDKPGVKESEEDANNLV